MEIRKRVGLLIREKRKVKGWSQEELSFRAGKHRTFVSNVERGTRNATVNSIHAIAKAMDLTVSELLQGLEQSDHEKPKRRRSLDK